MGDLKLSNRVVHWTRKHKAILLSFILALFEMSTVPEKLSEQFRIKERYLQLPNAIKISVFLVIFGTTISFWSEYRTRKLIMYLSFFFAGSLLVNYQNFIDIDILIPAHISNMILMNAAYFLIFVSIIIGIYRNHIRNWLHIKLVSDVMWGKKDE